MYWLDTLYLALLILAAALGAWTGLLWQAARLASLALAAYASLACHDTAISWTSQNLALGASDTVVHLLAYGGVFVGVYLLLYVITRILYQALMAVDLQSLDRWGGALLGACKMIIVLAGFSLAAVNCGHPSAAKLLQDSTLAPLLAKGLEKVILAMPADYKDNIHSTWKEVGAWVQQTPAGKTQPPGLDRNPKS